MLSPKRICVCRHLYSFFSVLSISKLKLIKHIYPHWQRVCKFDQSAPDRIGDYQLQNCTHTHPTTATTILYINIIITFIAVFVGFRNYQGDELAESLAWRAKGLELIRQSISPVYNSA